MNLLYLCYSTTLKQNATIKVELEFPDFPPVPLLKPELLKLTIIMKIEMCYLTQRQRCQFPS